MLLPFEEVDFVELHGRLQTEKGDEERKANILRHTPMGRFGKPEELVGAVLWLASDAASFVTGSLVTVDGGFTAMTI